MIHIFHFLWDIKLFFIKNKFKNLGKNYNISHDFHFQEMQYINIGNNFCCGSDVSIMAHKTNKNLSYENPILNIGNNVSISNHSFISCLNRIEIGDGVLLGVNTYISDNSHGNNTYDEKDIEPSKRKLYSKGPIIIGKNVWIGRNVCVMPNVIIGDYSIIGANSVVTHDIPSYSVACGCPAKVIKSIKNE